MLCSNDELDDMRWRIAFLEGPKPVFRRALGAAMGSERMPRKRLLRRFCGSEVACLKAAAALSSHSARDPARSFRSASRRD